MVAQDKLVAIVVPLPQAALVACMQANQLVCAQAGHILFVQVAHGLAINHIRAAHPAVVLHMYADAI